MLNKNAAMFGLDARIALAILGALSLVTGATLYKSLDKCDATLILSEMQSLGDAWVSYYTDTRQEPPRSNPSSTTDSYYKFATMAFVENTENLKGWNGPYMDLKDKGSNRAYYQNFSNKHADMGVYRDNFLNPYKWNYTQTKCSDFSTPCYVWSIRWYEDSFFKLKQIDKMVDNGDGPTKGDFRWSDYSNDTETKIFAALKLFPYKEDF